MKWLPLCLALALPVGGQGISLPGLPPPAAPLSPLPTTAPAHPTRAWSDVATLSYVATSGNAEGQTLGFGNDFLYKWTLSSLFLKVSAIRVSSTVVTRTAQGTSLEDAVVTETRTSSTTAESYLAQGRFDHRLKEKDRFYGFAALGWERNVPAGLQNRYATSAGLGYIWSDQERTRLRTDAGFGYVREEPLIYKPDLKYRFGTANLTAQLKQQVGASSLYAADFTGARNLSDADDYQVTLKQSLTVSVNRSLALKIGYDLIYRNRPNLIPVDVFDFSTPPVKLGQVSVDALRLDKVFTTSLVITF